MSIFTLWKSEKDNKDYSMLAFLGEKLGLIRSHNVVLSIYLLSQAEDFAIVKNRVSRDDDSVTR